MLQANSAHQVGQKCSTSLVPCSDCRLIRLYEVVKKLWAEILLAACGTFLLLPQELQEVWIKGRQLNLAHPKGSEIPFHIILMAVGGCCTGGEVGLGGIFDLLLVIQQVRELR